MVADDAETELLVVGGGPAGYVAAIRAGQLGVDVTLVERDAVGGVCLNRGCIPSKALLSATGLAHRASHATGMGVVGDVSVDVPAMVDWKDDVVEGLTGGVEKLCGAAGVTIRRGTAGFVGEHEAEVVPADGSGAGTVAFENAVVATGSRPIELPGLPFDDDPVLDSAAALDRRQPPERLVVVGAGYVGMELSTVYGRLGTAVSVVEMTDDVLPGFEPDLGRPVKRRAGELGVEFHFGQAATGWRPGPDGEGIIVLAEDGEGNAVEHPADAVLVAVGREPVTDTVGLDAVGLAPGEDGFLATDERCRTAVEHVLAVGDVAGEPMLAHKGMVEGEVAAAVVAGVGASTADRAIPAAVFTDPEIATVGLTEAAAEAAGHDPVVGRFPFGASGRALTLDEPGGFVRVVADGETERVLGGQLVGPEASELVAEVALAVELGARLGDLAGTVHTHPTLAEAVREAAANARGEAVHTLNR